MQIRTIKLIRDHLRGAGCPVRLPFLDAFGLHNMDFGEDLDGQNGRLALFSLLETASTNLSDSTTYRSAAAGAGLG